MEPNGAIRIGCSGWTMPSALQEAFCIEGSHLQRYARQLNACEINSSFHRSHRPATYERWAAQVPEDFVFSAKLPKQITHEHRLQDCESLVDTFLDEATGLQHRLACLLVQLPPSLEFHAVVAEAFFTHLRHRWSGRIALEPRHASWFSLDVDRWLAGRRVARVLADPVRHEPGRWPGGWDGLVYLRLHGSPRIYYSAYADTLLQTLAERMRVAAMEGREVWCIFDNTAGQAAAGNALRLRELLAR